MNDSSTGMDGEGTLTNGDDDENMVSSSEVPQNRHYMGDYSSPNFSRDKHLRYRTRVFAAEYVTCFCYLLSNISSQLFYFTWFCFWIVTICYCCRQIYILYNCVYINMNIYIFLWTVTHMYNSLLGLPGWNHGLVCQ